RLRTLNEITSPIVPTGTTRLRLRQAETGTPLIMRLLRAWRPACPAELGAVAPDAAQDDGQLAGDCHAGTRDTTALGDVHAPGSQRRPFDAADQQRVGRLIERGAGKFIATPANATLHVGFTGLIASGRQAEVCTNVARSAEAIRSVDGCAERQGSQRPDTLHCHEPPTYWLDTHLVEHTFGEPFDLA